MGSLSGPDSGASLPGAGRAGATRGSASESVRDGASALAGSPPGVLGDRLFRWGTRSAASVVVILFAAMIFSLVRESMPALRTFGFGFLVSAKWNPVTEEFGAMVAIVGTLVSSCIAMAIAAPMSLGIALFLTELAPSWLRGPIGTAIELLAAIPSIVYGMWGLFVIAPAMATSVEPWLSARVGFLPLFSGPPLGIGMATAGLVLAIMIIPFISSVTRDVFLMTPKTLKEAGYGLGCTRFEVIRDVVIPHGRKGIVGALFLGLGRALGETMAVTFVIGNATRLSWSLLAPGNSIASTLANEFTEADGDLYTAALIELGLILFLISFLVLGGAELWLKGGSKGESR